MEQKRPRLGLFFNEEEFQMENDGREERGKMTAEKTRKMLKDEGVEVTLEQAGMILEFLRKLANMAVSNYLKKKDEKNCRPIRESEYR
ncbi:hypothetical protein [Flavobacterium anhuiense]|uniref:hypothetical protein n=1 Tax=Flavobacterium anhuiense TaxID=459526 RepID=UPI0013C52ACC|nr:hypothetical protein [Flavobacterium anhuiense]